MSSKCKIDRKDLETFATSILWDQVLLQAFGLNETGEAYLATRRTLARSAVDPMTGLPIGSVYRITVEPEPTTGFSAICELPDDGPTAFQIKER